MTQMLNQLLKFYDEDPNDPFNIYGLALEYLKTDINKSRDLFDLLLAKHANYVPTYYHAAKLYQELNDRVKAIHIYEAGIRQAKKFNDQKALRELQSAYDELMFE